MSDLTYTVSMPFKRKGKDVLKDTEFILAISLDLKWFNPEQAKTVVSDALRSGLLKREGEFLRPSFDISKIEIPTGWKPDPFIVENKTIFDRIIDRIIQINKKQEEFSKQVSIEVSAILVAVENGIMVDDLIDEEYAALTTSSSS
jgi:hypothetical protein